MSDSLTASHCSRCRARLRAGELVGLEKEWVLCCMCLDLRTSTLAVIDRTEDSEESLNHLKKSEAERSPRQKI